MEAFSHISLVSSNLNIKKGVDTSTLKQDIKAIYRLAYGKDPNIGEQHESLIQQATHLGASLYLLGIHYQVFKFCAINVKWIKQNSEENSFNHRYNRWLRSKNTNDL